MHPFFHIGFLEIPAYGTLIMLGVAISFMLVKLGFFGKRDVDQFILISACIFGLGFIGARLLYVVVSPCSPYEALTMKGGFVFYGGLIGGSMGYFLGAKLLRIPYSSFIDVYAVLIPFVHAFGRLGCYFAGCCYGFPSKSFLSLPWYKVVGGSEKDVSYFPLQLLEASLLFGISICIWLVRGKFKKKSTPFLLYTLLYSVARFFLEYFRGDAYRGENVFWIFSTSQVVSLFIFALAMSLLLLSLKKRRSSYN